MTRATRPWRRMESAIVFADLPAVVEQVRVHTGRAVGTLGRVERALDRGVDLSPSLLAPCGLGIQPLVEPRLGQAE